MSSKRRAETQLGPDNWDEEEPAESEDKQEQGFKTAPKDVLEKRVIRTAKRRTALPSADAANKPIFSGFSGFNKTQKSSFDFLANLTNGSKPNNESTTLKSDTVSVSSSSMFNKPASTNSGLFSLSGASTPNTKSVFGQPTSDSTKLSGAGFTPTFTQSVFSSSKPDSTVNENPFKTPSASSTQSANFNTKPATSSEKPVSQVSSTLFGAVSVNNSPFSSKNNSTTNTTVFTTTVNSSPQPTEVNKPVKTTVKDEKDLVYYNNLKSLNVSVAAWINKHVEETPLCILTPIFRDYERHLKDIQDNYEKSKGTTNKSDTKDANKEAKVPVTSGNNSSSTLFSGNSASTTSVFSLSSSSISSTVEKISNYTFGINTASSTTANNSVTAVSSSTGFTFGVKPSSSSTFSTNTSVNAKSSTTSNSSPFSSTANTGLSFGIKATSASASPFAITTTTSANNGTTPNASPFSTNQNTPSSTAANNFATPSTGFSFGIKPSNASTSISVVQPFSTNNTTDANIDTTPNTSPFSSNAKTPVSSGANNFAITATPSPGFSFGVKSPNTNASPFSTNTTTTTSGTTLNASPFATNTSTNNASSPFSFGIGKPFAFNSNIKKTEETTNEGDDNEDEPPKVEYTPMAEENSVYDKKCKVFVKKDGNFIDKGVGTLYIKTIEESGKHQLLVRANTSLGNVLINMILSSSLPTQRMGKNNVMMVCMPTPDAKPPPTSVLIRVKTSEDADELLDTLNKYKA